MSCMHNNYKRTSKMLFKEEAAGSQPPKGIFRQLFNNSTKAKEIMMREKSWVA